MTQRPPSPRHLHWPTLTAGKMHVYYREGEWWVFPWRDA